MFFVVFFCSFTVIIAQLKIPPIMGMVIENLNVSLTSVGLIMSVFTITGIVLAIPGAAIMNKVGAKNLLVFLMFCVIVGNILGAFAENFAMLIVSRVIEGISYALIIMVSIFVISTVFAGQRGGGLAMGLYNIFAPLGSAITLNVGLQITQSLGFKSLWFIVAGFGAVSLLLAAFVLKLPKADAAAQGQGPAEKISIAEAAKNSRTWILAFTMFVVAYIMFVCFQTYPVWYEQFYGLDTGRANFFASFNGLGGIPFCLLTGLLLEKTKKPYLICLLGMLGLVITAFTFDLLGPSTYAAHGLFSSLVGGFGMTTVMFIAPQLAKKPQFIGYAIAFVNFIYFFGVFASSPVTLWVIESSGFIAAKYVLTAIAAVGLILSAVQYTMARKAKSPGI